MCFLLSPQLMLSFLVIFGCPFNNFNQFCLSNNAMGVPNFKVYKKQHVTGLGARWVTKIVTIYVTFLALFCHFDVFCALLARLAAKKESAIDKGRYTGVPGL